MLTIAVAIAVGFIGFTFSGSTNEVQADSTDSITSNNLLGDACKNVKFKVVNKHKQGGEIEVRAVKYYNRANGSWQTEDVPNTVVKQGDTLLTNGDDLRDSEGESITEVYFVYRWKAGRNGNWSGEVDSKKFTPNSTVCVKDKVYGTSSWIIGG